jgi:hypothetical protein
MMRERARGIRLAHDEEVVVFTEAFDGVVLRKLGKQFLQHCLFRWLERYAPEINKRVRQHLEKFDTSLFRIAA